MTNRDPGTQAGPTDTDPRPAAVTFVTTEHFTLQGARSSTIAEATGRATMFLGAVSGGLVALGLVATTSNAGAAFYAFGLVLLPLRSCIACGTSRRSTPACTPGDDQRSWADTSGGWSFPRCP